MFFESFVASVSLSVEQPETPSKPKLKRATTIPRLSEFTAVVLLSRKQSGCVTTPVAPLSLVFKQTAEKPRRDACTDRHVSGEEVIDR